MTLKQKKDESILNILKLLNRFSKIGNCFMFDWDVDPKLPVFSRLYGCIDVVLELMDIWKDVKEFQKIMTGVNILKVWCTKNGKLFLKKSNQYSNRCKKHYC